MKPNHLLRALALLLPVAASLMLTGCKIEDIPGLGPDPRQVAREAEAKAVGGGCRHAMRGLEDCYALNPKASKALVFAGWKDMDEYMRSNKMEGVPSVLGQAVPEKRSEEAEGTGSRNRS
ncbi:MAG: hypothetical protein RR473_07510 [Comamonas sp.]|uniref:hypothetical protein n=1 Tax=Comamonas sp. TaxID=34028 RepID=UPI003037E8B2